VSSVVGSALARRGAGEGHATKIVGHRPSWGVGVQGHRMGGKSAGGAITGGYWVGGDGWWGSGRRTARKPRRQDVGNRLTTGGMVGRLGGPLPLPQPQRTRVPIDRDELRRGGAEKRIWPQIHADGRGFSERNGWYQARQRRISPDAGLGDTEDTEELAESPCRLCRCSHVVFAHSHAQCPSGSL
jgi:hypothetical protein